MTEQTFKIEISQQPGGTSIVVKAKAQADFIVKNLTRMLKADPVLCDLFFDALEQVILGDQPEAINREANQVAATMKQIIEHSKTSKS